MTHVRLYVSYFPSNPSEDPLTSKVSLTPELEHRSSGYDDEWKEKSFIIAYTL